MSRVDPSVHGGRNCAFPQYASMESTLDDELSESTPLRQEPHGLPKIQQLLRKYSEESLWPAAAPSSTTCGSSRFGAPMRRSTLALWSMVVLTLMGTVVHIIDLLPTKEEKEIAKHYYGDSTVYQLPGSTLRLRQAQTTADESFDPQHQRSLKKRHKKKRKKRADEQVQPVQGLTSPTLHEGCESSVLLLRHCEKGSVAEHCAYNGFERSVYLAESVFGKRWPYPVAIFAESPGGRRNPNHLNFRELETVGPLAIRSNITVDDSYDSGTIHQLSKTILEEIRSGRLCGQVVVIVWKHSGIAHIGRLLGCGPAQGCPLDYHGRMFDQVWQLKYVYRDWKHSSRKHHFGPTGKQPSWKVFGSVQEEGFDPLAVSYEYGDYPQGGTQRAGRWREDAVDFPERRHKDDKARFETKNVDFSEAP